MSAAVSVALVLLALALSSTASAAHLCDSVAIADGTVVRVATKGTSCRLGREVAARYFERQREGGGFDGKTAEGSIYYSVGGFRCFPGLGGSQVFCHRRQQSIFASSRPEDHPATWR